MKNEVLTKDGKLSAYGFACGYQESEEKNGNKKNIHMECGVYWVTVSTPGIGTGTHWKHFNFIRNARKFYKNIKL